MAPADSSGAVALLAAFIGVDASAELVRCTSKDGSSVIRRDKCDSPDDVRTPVTAKSPVARSSPTSRRRRRARPAGAS